MNSSCLLAVAVVTLAAGTCHGAEPEELEDGQHLAVAAPTLQPIARWAVPSNTMADIGYYVGGGCGRPCKAEPRRPDEGTWGWDYQGWLIRRRVILGWWHGRRYQGGTGAYKTDGPHYHEMDEETH